MPQSPAHHDHDHRGHAHHQHNGDDGLADLLDLDGQVLADYWAAAFDWLHGAAAGTDQTRLLDLGAGTGTGAINLAQRFTGTIVAVDVSADSLQRLRVKASELGFEDRIDTVQADLDAEWPDLGTLDLTWASMSLHHLADPARVLRDVLAASRPGGLIAVAEFAAPLRFLPENLGVGRPGFEDRVNVLRDRARAEDMPTLGTAWAPRLADAGWHIVDEQAFTIDQNPPWHPDATKYARGWFARLSAGFGEQLEPDDQLTLAALLDEHGPHSLLRRTDLHLRGIRTITLGRRG
ncbi:MAG TPA: class I SAM-dependent methyltransferase [Jatrophihabitans sp.]|nr:class I SAM-dependent methyltransferase [Jatrophihabitans sp.]